MLAEVLALTALVLIGGVTAMALHVDSASAVVVLSLPLGVAVVVAVGLGAGIVGFPLQPVSLLAYCGVPTLALLAFAFRRAPPRAWGGLLAAWALTVTGGALLHGRGLIHVTPDSFWYLAMGSEIARGGSLSPIDGRALHERGIALPLVHSLGELGGDYYLHAIGPLLTLSMLGALIWMGTRALRSSLGSWRYVVPCAGALLLATNAGVLFHAFYLNSHMLFAVWTLLVGGMLWLGASDRLPHYQLWPVVVMIAALAILRPEAALTLSLVLTPSFVSPKLDSRLKAGMLVGLGLPVAAWHGLLLFKKDVLRIETLGMFGFGLLTILIAGLVLADAIRLQPWLMRAVGVGIMLAVAISAMLQPDIFIPSLTATMTNISSGGPYGSLILIVTGTLLLLAMSRRIQATDLLAFPLTTALPYGLLLAHLRGGRYRVGTGDSLSRMILHWLPLVVLLLIAYADSVARDHRFDVRGESDKPLAEL